MLTNLSGRLAVAVMAGLGQAQTTNALPAMSEIDIGRVSIFYMVAPITVSAIHIENGTIPQTNLLSRQLQPFDIGQGLMRTTMFKNAFRASLLVLVLA